MEKTATSSAATYRLPVMDFALGSSVIAWSIPMLEKQQRGVSRPGMLATGCARMPSRWGVMPDAVVLAAAADANGDRCYPGYEVVPRQPDERHRLGTLCGRRRSPGA